MKNILRYGLIFMMAGLLFLAGCSSPFSGLGTTGDRDNSLVDTGLRLSLTPNAAWVLAAFESMAAEAGDSGPGEVRGTVADSRAFMMAELVEIVVEDAEGNEIYSESFDLGMLGTEFEHSVTIPAGTGYIVRVYIYNNQVSTDSPVVSGTATGIDVTAGALTPLSITCVPASPISLTDGVAADVSVVPYTLDAGYAIITNGGELWFEIIAPASGTVHVAPDFSDGISYVVGIFDDEGNLLPDYNWSGQLPAAGSFIFSGLVPEDNYYLGLLAIGPSVDEVSGTILLEVLTATELSETEVPDIALRAYFETETGKEFITAANPDPTDPITDLDLAGIPELYLQGMAITTFKGLEYCIGATDLYIDGTDLSSVEDSDEHFITPLSGMSSLYWTDFTDCSLSTIDFLSVIPNLGGCYIRRNSDLRASSFVDLTPANFPYLKYLYLSGWDINDDGTWDETDIFSGSDWDEVLALLRPFTDLGSLEVSSFGLNDTDFAKLFENGEVLDSNKAHLGSFFAYENSLTNTSLPLIASLESLDYLDLTGMIGISDISALQTMVTMEYLVLNGTGISDIDPLLTLYDAGAFRNHRMDDPYDIQLNSCPNLEMTYSSGNLQVLDDLTSNAVRVAYDEELAFGGTWYSFVYWADGSWGQYLKGEHSNESWTMREADDSIYDEGTIVEWDNEAASLIYKSIDHPDLYVKMCWAEGEAKSFVVHRYEGQSILEDARSSETVEKVNSYYSDVTIVPPKILLSGDNPMELMIDGIFSDPGATALDWNVADAPALVSGTVDTSIAGTYTLTYTFTDSDDNTAEPVTRTVEVVDGGTVDVTIQ